MRSAKNDVKVMHIHAYTIICMFIGLGQQRDSLGALFMVILDLFLLMCCLPPTNLGHTKDTLRTDYGQTKDRLRTD